MIGVPEWPRADSLFSCTHVSHNPRPRPPPLIPPAATSHTQVYDSDQSKLLYPVNYLRNYARMQVGGLGRRGCVVVCVVGWGRVGGREEEGHGGDTGTGTGSALHASS